MLVPLVLCSVVAAVAGSPSIIFPGQTKCVAPSGRQGVCLLPSDCPPARGPPATKPCGHHQRRLKFCCEPASAEPLRQSEPLPADCGRGGPSDVGTNGVPNISNGRPAEQRSWPWTAVVGRREANGRVLWDCAGSLLGPRHVLTAAHCAAGAVGQLAVRLGEHDLSTAADGEHQDRGVRRVARHPNFRRSSNDLAVLELDRPVQLGPAVHPVCLPKPEANLVGRAGWVVGWGELGFGSATANVLQEALIGVVATDQCEREYQRTPQYSFLFPSGFGGGVLCASDPRKGGRDACNGDSGGPLVVQRPDGRYQLAGVVLGGFGCGSADFAGLYTNVASYIDWIRGEVFRS